MLLRVVAFALGFALMLVACKRVSDSQLVGTWRMSAAENAGKLRFDRNHTFTGGEWSLTSSHQPSLMPDKGDWHIIVNKLVLDFRDNLHETKHQELVLVVRDDDNIMLRQPDGAEITLKRGK